MVLAHGLPPISLGLIPIMQAEMGAEFERPATKAERSRFRVDRGGDRPVREAQIADGQFDGCAGARCFSGREMMAGESLLYAIPTMQVLMC